MKNNIEELKAKALNKDRMMLVRYAAFLELEKLLTSKEFEEIKPEYNLFKKEMFNIFED